MIGVLLLLVSDVVVEVSDRRAVGSAVALQQSDVVVWQSKHDAGHPLKPAGAEPLVLVVEHAIAGKSRFALRQSIEPSRCGVVRIDVSDAGVSSTTTLAPASLPCPQKAEGPLIPALALDAVPSLAALGSSCFNVDAPDAPWLPARLTLTTRVDVSRSLGSGKTWFRWAGGAWRIDNDELVLTTFNGLAGGFVRFHPLGRYSRGAAWTASDNGPRTGDAGLVWLRAAPCDPPAPVH